ncbi:MAG: phosphatase PAP2 family protein, partial [Pontibacterium sp.]
MPAFQQRFTYYDAVLFEYCLSITQVRILAVLSRNVSRLGDGLFYGLAGISLALLEPMHGQDFLINGLLVFALELPLYLMLKNTFKRQRPCHKYGHIHAHIVPSDKFSLPSGHAAAAFVFASVVAFYYPDFA